MNISHAEFNAEIKAIETRINALHEHIDKVARDFDKKVEELKVEFRNAKWWAMGTAVALIGVMVGLQMLTNSWEQSYLSAYSARVDAVTNRMDAMSTQMNAMQNTLNIIVQKLNHSSDFR